MAFHLKFSDLVLFSLINYSSVLTIHVSYVSFISCQDFAMHLLFAFLWLAASSAWASGLTNLKSATSLESIMKGNPEMCLSYQCTPGKGLAYSKLVISIVSSACMYSWPQEFLYTLLAKRGHQDSGSSVGNSLIHSHRDKIRNERWFWIQDTKHLSLSIGSLFLHYITVLSPFPDIWVPELIPVVQQLVVLVQRDQLLQEQDEHGSRQWQRSTSRHGLRYACTSHHLSPVTYFLLSFIFLSHPHKVICFLLLHMRLTIKC